MTIKVFKKDEPTFDTSRLEIEDAWRVYVNDYLSLAPTIGVDIDKVHLSLLRRNLRIMTNDGTINPSFGIEESNSESGRRYDLAKARESLEFRISVEDAKIYYQVNSEESWQQPFAVREGGKQGVEDSVKTSAVREEGFQDSYVRNSTAMVGLSKADVEGKNESYGIMVKDGVNGADEGGAGIAMEE